ncbi:unnamed protein product [Aspergillus oryzae]|nr:unnamed protein product [Aspergillus oryzae]GMF88550.1 unnamed protein product [Aspergillus oryzae]
MKAEPHEELDFESLPPALQRKLVHLAAQVDSRCFHSLPPKIQQKLFSKEEQDWFYRAQFEARFFDAAGEAPHPLEKARHCSRHQPPEIRFSDGNSIATSRSSTLYFDLSDSDLSSDTDMDYSLCDNFRWFDDNGDLDLRLDEYHAHVAKTLPNSPPRRRPSLRTALSFNPDVSIRQPTSAVSRQKAQSARRSSTFPTAPMNITARNSSSRPSSSQSQTHVPRSSTSSIDPSAQYYQDPEARLKLRVYLASPQNFDEAVEFGFPAQNNERTMPAERKTKPPMFTGTFLDEEDTSVSDERCDKRMNVARLSYVHNSRSSDSGRPYPRHQSWLLPPRPGNQQNTGSNREMTLKMTLTRPDLRTTVPPPRVDPLKLPLEDSGSHLWGSCEDEQGLMKKMWRNCLLLALLAQRGAAKSSSPKIAPPTKIDHKPSSLFYFEDTDTVLMNTVNGDLLRSVDAGETWSVVEGDDGGMKHHVLLIRQHPYDNKKAYALGPNGRHWVTTDQAKTWASFNIAEFPAIRHYPLVFHGGDSSKVIFQGEECAGRYCIVRSYYTTDDFATVKLLRESTGGCAWAVGHPQFAEDLNLAEEIKDRSFCVVPGLKVPLPHANRLVYSDDYFRGNAEGTETKLQEGRPVSGVISTAAVKKFIVAAAKSKGTEELALYVTVDAKNWHRAEFDGHRIEEDAYTMLESTNYSLQVDVLTSPRSGMGVLFTSNSNGTYFTRNIEHTNRNSEGMVDFEKIAGIQGIVLVNTVQNPEEVESGSAKKKITSRISFDDGRTFQPLKSDGENLHLHSVTALRNIGRVFSSPAPGLVMGIGNTGNHLQEYAECNLYISDDAGVTWRRAIKHPHKYEFGDQGAVVIAVRDEGRVDKINYSLDHGKEWASVELQHKIYPTMVTTTPDSTSLKFIVVGSLKESQDGEHVIYSIDFDGLHERKCEEDDFEKWPARLDEHGKPDCLMGHKQFYMRRRANANCFVDEEFKDPQPIFEACKCTAEDFECEYRRTEDGKGCVIPSPLTPPEGECKKPDDKFMGPSGWRLIPGDACIRDGGENLDKEIERSCKDASSPSTDGKIRVTLQLLEARDYAQYYYLERQSSSSGSDETIIMLSSEHEVYVTHDHGKTWERPLKGEEITRVYLHPYSSDVAFLLTDGKEGFWTEDRGHTFKPFQAPAPPTQDRFLQVMAFHPVHKDRLIWTGAVDCHSGDCHSDAFIKKGRGKNWEPLLSYVQKCEFESRETRPNSTNLVYCEQFEKQSKNGRLQLLSSDDFFNDNEVQFVDVINYATMSEFIIVASRQPENPDSLVASTSVDGRTFARAQFPPNVQVPVQTAYTVLESSTHAVFLHVTASSTEGGEYGPIIKSNSNGTSYVLSISAVNRNSLGYVDFEKAQGLEGVAVVNVVSNVADVSKKVPKKLKTMITHNDGAQWMLLPPPTKDADDKSFGCSVVAGKGTDDCSLHLHGYTERKDERDTFASGSAIGLMMAVGNVGDHLAGGDEADTFITNDGGISWKSVKKGKYMWEYGDSGSVIVIVPESKPTKTIHYSLDEGDTWEEFQFSDVEVRINDISTVPSDTSKNFLLWARLSNSEVQDKFATFNIDFSGVRPRPCLLDENQGNSDDYYIWEPKHPFQENNCLFGHSEQYHRKKPSAQCWNDWRESHVHSIGTNCTCTRADYECDGSCALVPGLPKPDAMEICKKDPDTIEYWEPTGYRRIPQTTCQGGLNLDHFVSKPCPNKEEEYKQKHGISGVGLFFAIVTPLAVAGAAGYYAYSKWDGKFGQIRLGESAGTSQSFLSRDSWLVTVPIAIVAGTVAVARALPLLVTSLWRGASGFIRLGRGRGYSRPYASRGSFAARRGDYTSIVDDEDELLGVEDAELDEDDEA